MTTQANQQNTTVILRDEHDYRAWYSQLQARCITYSIWEQVNPDGTKQLLKKPNPPNLPSITEYTPSTALPEGVDPARLSDLSSAGQRAYKDDIEIYKLSMERYKAIYAEYKAEITNLQHIVIWIQSTVAAHLQRTCCPPDGSIRDWIKNLRTHVGITREAEQEQARQRYHNALKPPRSVNTWDTWLAEYNQAITEAETLNVPETTQFKIVAADFMSAVNKIAPIWAATFQLNGKDQPGITQKDMMRRFREYMMLNHPITRNRSQKAAFVVDDPSVFLAANSNADQRVDGDAHHVETGNSRVRKRGRPRYQRTASEESDVNRQAPGLLYPQRGRGKSAIAYARGKTAKADAAPGKPVIADARGPKCPACDMGHTLRDCFYVYNEKAPEWWEPNPRTAQFVALRQEHDPEFQSLLRAQSRPRTRTPITKQSQTPTPDILDN